MKTNIKIVFVDDHTMFRETIVEKLNQEKLISVVGSFGEAESMIQFIRKNKVDIILLDIDLPEMDGYTAMKKVHEINPDLKVIIISFHTESNYISKFMTEGACSFIPKVLDFEEILDAIFCVYENGKYINETIKNAIVNSAISQNSLKRLKLKPDFTKREIEIITLICQSKNAKEIAQKLCVVTKTIEGHKSRIMDKMNVKSSIGIVRYAILNRLIDEEQLI